MSYENSTNINISHKSKIVFDPCFHSNKKKSSWRPVYLLFDILTRTLLCISMSGNVVFTDEKVQYFW